MSWLEPLGSAIGSVWNALFAGRKQIAFILEEQRKEREERRKEREEEREGWKKEREAWKAQVDQLRAEMESRVIFFKAFAEEVRGLNAAQVLEVAAVRNLLDVESLNHRKCRQDINALQEENESQAARIAHLERRADHGQDPSL